MIFEVIQKERHQFIMPKESLLLLNLFSRLKPSEVKETWKPVRVEVVSQNLGRKLKESHIFSGAGSPRPIFNGHAVSVLSDILTQSGNLLPLVAESGEDLFLHNTQVIDALDYERSAVRRFKSGEVMYVERPVFRASLVRSLDMFVLPAGNLHSFVSRRFRERVQDHKLQGVDFAECLVIED